MPSGMTAVAFVEKHGDAIVRWLRNNTTACTCDSTLMFGADEKLARPTCMTCHRICFGALRAVRQA